MPDARKVGAYLLTGDYFERDVRDGFNCRYVTTQRRPASWPTSRFPVVMCPTLGALTTFISALVNR